MRDQRLGHFYVTAQTGGRAEIIYTATQLQQLRLLSCAAAGVLDLSGIAMPAGTVANDCATRTRIQDLNNDLRDVARSFAEQRQRTQNDNDVLYKAAILHSDIAMLESTPVDRMSAELLPFGPRRIRVELVDGQPVGTTLTGIHWELAESALGFSKPLKSNRPAPERDPWVRAWYRATTAWMQQAQQYDPQHLEQALTLFAKDPDLLFLSGALHETYAASAALSRVHGSSDIRGLPQSSLSEWRLAERSYAEVVANGGANAEVQLHRGRVLNNLGRVNDAVPMLSTALSGLTSPAKRYYAALFLGFAEETLGQHAKAHAAYQQAHDLFPAAQTPAIALAHLASKTGEFSTVALLPSMLADTSPDADPWWAYNISHVDNAATLVNQVWTTLENPQ
jgi:hypothetical protein